MSRSSAEDARRGAEPLVTLTSDFGTRDGYVGAMKGRILAICREVRIVDLTHALAPQDLHGAAWALARAVPHFPAGTIHLAVIDPGVGSARGAVVVRAGTPGAEQLLVGPDNGIFGRVIEELGGSWAAWRVATGEAGSGAAMAGGERAEWRKDHSFDGLALFAPLAGHLARGMEPKSVGPQVAALERLAPALEPPQRPARAGAEVLPGGEVPTGDSGGLVASGGIERFDRFGNAITNIPGDWVEPGMQVELAAEGSAAEGAREGTFLPLLTHYAEGRGRPGLGLVNSDRRLEIAVYEGSARRELKLQVGSRVRVWH